MIDQIRRSKYHIFRAKHEYHTAPKRNLLPGLNEHRSTVLTLRANIAQMPP